MKILCLILLLLVIGLLIYLAWLFDQIKKLEKQLNYLEDKESRMRVQTPIRKKEFQDLVGTINRFIDADHKRKAQLFEDRKRSQEILVGLSHDIRTPLTSLSGYLQLMAWTDDPKKKAYYLEIMEERLASLSNNLEDLFTFSKLNQDDYPISPEPLDFKEFFLHELFAYYEDFKQRGIEPSLDLGDQPLIISADPNALSRVIQNILKNVLRHGADKLTVEMGQGVHHGEDQIFLKIKNGRKEGEDLDSDLLFQKFYKADPSRGTNSTGLGLSIARSLVEMMGGEIEGEVDQKSFSIFVFFRPFNGELN